MKNKTRETKKRSGFTLIELIVVLAILGILAAIAVPNFTAIQEDAKLKADTATANGMLKAARLQHFSDGKADGEAIGNLEKGYFDATNVTTQSKTGGTFKLGYRKTGTAGAAKTEYIVYWIVDDKGNADATDDLGHFVLESTDKINGDAIVINATTRAITGIDGDETNSTADEALLEVTINQ